MGFTASETDPGLFIAHYKGSKVYVLVYVDDILVASKSLEDIQHVKHSLTEALKVRDLGETKYFLGMSLDRNRQARTLKMTQERLAAELVSKYGMKEGKTKTVPMSTSIKLVRATEENMLDKEAHRYSELVGRVLYLLVCTRPDISQAWEFWLDTWHGALDSSQGNAVLHSWIPADWHTVWERQHYCGSLL